PLRARARRARPDHRAVLRDGSLSGAVPEPHAAVDRSHPGARRGRARAAAGSAMIDVGPFVAHWEAALPGLLIAATAMLILPAGEYFALMLLSTSGMVFMAAANDLIVIFLALEIMSVAVYVLVGMLRREVRSNEASLKYFLLGAFATGFLLYGIAFFYGATGSTRLDVVARVAARDGLTPFMVLGLALLLVGFGFKVALIPFHVWTPDVYEGAPTAVTAFMAVGVKAAAFAAFARVFLDALLPVAAGWTGVLWVLAALT